MEHSSQSKTKHKRFKEEYTHFNLFRFELIDQYNSLNALPKQNLSEIYKSLFDFKNQKEYFYSRLSNPELDYHLFPEDGYKKLDTL
jgi:hypothetical protein